MFIIWNFIKKVILFLLILPLPVLAQLSPYSVNGYVKYLFSTAKFPLVDERLNDHLIHARINTHWYSTEFLIAALELRLRGFYGGSVQKSPGFKRQTMSDYDNPKMDAVLWDEDKSLGYGQIDRFYLDYTKDNLQVTAGRQRIAWGTALVWNVIDLFNPMSILDFDYEEKPGTDALRIQYYTGAVSKLELAIKPNKNKFRRTFAGLWSTNSFGYDFFVIAAFQNNRKVFGGAWVGDIAGGGFRGELKVSDPPSKGAPTTYPVPPQFGCSLFEDDKRVTSFILSVDYTFPSSFYIHAEALYNSNGKQTNAGLFQMQALEAGMLSPARWSLYQEFAYDVTPLLRSSFFGIFNPDDGSSIIIPSLTWSVVTNLDCMVIGYYTFGDLFTEWGDFGNSLYMRLKYSF